MKTMLPTLLAVVALLAGCQPKSTTLENDPPTTTPTSTNTATALVTDSGFVSHGVELDRPIPLSSYQPVVLQDVAASDTSYSALVPCHPDTAGELSVQIQLKPQRHSIEKLTLLYAATISKRTLIQVGQGVGHYDPKSRRYFFEVAYQTITELPNNMRRNSELYKISGWVSTETTAAGVQPISIFR